MTCATCEHCDTSESRPNVRGERIAILHGAMVTVWQTCPKYSPRRDDDA